MEISGVDVKDHNMSQWRSETIPLRWEASPPSNRGFLLKGQAKMLQARSDCACYTLTSKES